jgi:hypothetical protein
MNTVVIKQGLQEGSRLSLQLHEYGNLYGTQFLTLHRKNNYLNYSSAACVMTGKET